MPYKWEDLDESKEFHSVFSIQLVELVENGVVDFDSDFWDFDSYDDAQRSRLWAKFYARYKYRELGVLPPMRWHDEVIRKLNEVMPKYKYLYKALDDGVDPFMTENRYGKSRNVFSDFPQTALGGSNQDYASNGTDREYEDITNGDFIEKADALANRYKDVDALILDELETCFSCFVTVSMNGF